MNSLKQQPRSESDQELAHWVDPATGREFVLVPLEQFAKLSAFFDKVGGRAGWDDPALDAYEQYRKTQ